MQVQVEAVVGPFAEQHVVVLCVYSSASQKLQVLRKVRGSEMRGDESEARYCLFTTCHTVVEVDGVIAACRVGSG